MRIGNGRERKRDFWMGFKMERGGGNIERKKDQKVVMKEPDGMV